jgi:adenine-specific DNA-methyltransferase
MTNTGMISNNTNDHNNANDLQAIIDAQAERLRAQDATIKDQERLLAIGHHLGLAYNTIPETGDAQRLLNGEVPVLTADPARSTVKTGSSEDDHVLIEGDNLTALTMLQATHKGKVNVIYIDPPYNTGNQDFVYNDRFVDPEDSYRHSKWLSFMRPRLVLARELLTNDGVIFVSIDDHEHAYLKVMMDEVFGENNFIGNMIWKKSSGGKQDAAGNNISTVTEYVLMYARDKGKARINGLEKDYSSYKMSDEHVQRRGRYRLNQLDRNGLRYNASLDYPIMIDGKTYVPHKSTVEEMNHRHEHHHERDWAWRWSARKVEWGIEHGFIVGKNGKVYSKEYMNVDNEDNLVNKVSTPYNLIGFGGSMGSRLGNKELQDIFGGRTFSYPKPVNMIEYLLKIRSRGFRHPRLLRR